MNHSRTPANTVTIAEMRALEAEAMSAGITEPDIMNLAGVRLGHAIGRHFPTPGTAVAFPGKGHNGGDALIALGVLRDQYDWSALVHTANDYYAHAPLTRRQLDAHRKTRHLEGDDVHDPDGWRDPTHPLLLLDGLLGIGADGSPLRGPTADAAAIMRNLRRDYGAVIAAVDLPSGLDADSGAFPENAVPADVTFTLGAAKSGLLAPAAANAVGAIRLVAIRPLTAPAPASSSSTPRLICPQHLAAGAAPRPFDFHKGMAGRVSILAGSPHYSGAAVLCATGALRAGAGLVTLHVSRAAHALIAAKCPPEIIVRAFDTLEETAATPADAWVAGCGLGDGWDRALVDFLLKIEAPVVLDADALNALADHGRADETRAHHLFTPHPGEFGRLTPKLAGLPPLDAAVAWTRLSPATLLLKGCRTVVASRAGAPWVNSTGHPGMATAGQGDVLAGVAGALLAAGHAIEEAAALAAWLCGRAAERAVTHHGHSAESLAASHVLENLGAAFFDWRGAAR